MSDVFHFMKIDLLILQTNEQFRIDVNENGNINQIINEIQKKYKYSKNNIMIWIGEELFQSSKSIKDNNIKEGTVLDILLIDSVQQTPKTNAQYILTFDTQYDEDEYNTLPPSYSGILEKYEDSINTKFYQYEVPNTAFTNETEEQEENDDTQQSKTFEQYSEAHLQQLVQLIVTPGLQHLATNEASFKIYLEQEQIKLGWIRLSQVFREIDFLLKSQDVLRNLILSSDPITDIFKQCYQFSYDFEVFTRFVDLAHIKQLLLLQLRANGEEKLLNNHKKLLEFIKDCNTNEEIQLQQQKKQCCSSNKGTCASSGKCGACNNSGNVDQKFKIHTLPLEVFIVMMDFYQFQLYHQSDYCKQRIFDQIAEVQIELAPYIGDCRIFYNILQIQTPNESDVIKLLRFVMHSSKNNADFNKLLMSQENQEKITELIGGDYLLNSLAVEDFRYLLDSFILREYQRINSPQNKQKVTIISQLLAQYKYIYSISSIRQYNRQNVFQSYVDIQKLMKLKMTVSEHLRCKEDFVSLLKDQDIISQLVMLIGGDELFILCKDNVSILYRIFLKYIEPVSFYQYLNNTLKLLLFNKEWLIKYINDEQNQNLVEFYDINMQYLTDQYIEKQKYNYPLDKQLYLVAKEATIDEINENNNDLIILLEGRWILQNIPSNEVFSMLEQYKYAYEIQRRKRYAKHIETMKEFQIDIPEDAFLNILDEADGDMNEVLARIYNEK